jgi:hypothetical protein
MKISAYSTKRYWSDRLRVTEVMDVKVSAYTSTASLAAANVTTRRKSPV